MKTLLSFVAIVALSACMSGGGGSGATASMDAPGLPSGTPAPPPTTGGSFTSMLNGVRADSGAGPVSFDSRLGAAAQGHANDMLAHNYFSHTGRDGSSAGDRIRAAGYDWRTYGENIAKGQQSEAAVLEAWQNSSGHRRNNLNPNFEDFGLAKAGSGSNTYWVLVLATER